MITSTPITNSVTPQLAFKATDTGRTGGTGQRTAVTTIALCNIGVPDLTDETVDSVTVNIYLVKATESLYNTATSRNKIVSSLTIPAGETVFFNDERLILEVDDSIYIGASAGDIDTVGSFDTGVLYIIETTGGSDFTTCGASASTPGTVFEATNDGSSAGGTGTARRVLITSTVSSLEV